MRYARIFFLTFQDIFQQRGRTFVWFLISLFGPLITLLFWRGATQGGKVTIYGWNYQTISSYYFFLIVATSLLISNIEDDVAKFDIQMGNLVNYLLKPISYLSMKFIQDMPYKIIKGFFGITICLILFFALHGKLFVFSSNILVIFLAFIICLFAILLSFLFKMILGLVAFWIIEIRGIYEVVDAVMFIFAGYVLPIFFLPYWIAHIAYLLPFSYMIYFPIVALEGRLSFLALLQTIGMQVLWLGILYVTYRFMWRKGIKKFSGVGQ